MREAEELIDLTWLFFYTAAGEVVERLGVSTGKARQMLREACISGEVRSKKMVLRDDEWVEEPTKPSEWAKDEIDIEEARKKRATDTDTIWFNFNVETLSLEERHFLETWAQFKEIWKKRKDARSKYIAWCEAKGYDPTPILEVMEEEDQRRPGDAPVGVLVNGDDFWHWLFQQPTPVGQQFTPPSAGGKQSRIIRLLADLHPTGVPDRGDCPREQLKANLLARDPSLNPLDPKTLRNAIDAYNRQVGKR
jgi:hypothetical protein